jgi:carboxyl-terminal processing protease
VEAPKTMTMTKTKAKETTKQVARHGDPRLWWAGLTAASAYLAYATLPAWAQSAAPGSGARVFAEAKALLLSEYYDDKLPGGTLDLAAVQGMLNALNGGKAEGPNALLDARAMTELKRDLKGELIGIGTMIDYDEATGMARVDGLLPGSAAASAGIERGDRILSVDGVGVRGRPLKEVVSAIRGSEGTSVKLALLRGSATVEKNIVRRRLTLTSVEHSNAAEVGVLTIRMFSERTPGELETALNALKAGGMQRLLVDLRGNGGGLFEKSLESAELLLPKGAEIVRTMARGQKVTRHLSKRDPLIAPMPIVVIVDKSTASSAEVLAEALRVSAGATLVGTRTYGKWRMETLRPIADGYSLKFTIGLLQSPAGQGYDTVGLPPDVEVPGGPEPVEHTRRLLDINKRMETDPQLKAAVHILRRLRA